MKEQEQAPMSHEELRTMQLIQVEILKEFDRICRLHQICYAIEGGTLLGAVRHKGFIPWDDDIDVAILRSEYEKFCAVCEQELDQERFFFQNHTTDPAYRWGYGKILRKGTSYVRVHQEHMKMKNGVYIELLPMDGIPANPLSRRGVDFIRLCCRKLMYSEVGKLHANSLLLRLWYRIYNRIPVEAAFYLLDCLAKRYDEQKAKWVTCLSYHDCWVSGYYGFDRSFYVDTQEIEFEGCLFQGPEDAEALLRVLFGDDYRTLPPEEERVARAPASSFHLLDDEFFSKEV